MSETAHTPGPWAAEQPMDFEIMIVQGGKEAFEWKTIAGLPFPEDDWDIPRDQVEANATLMAASPDMLSALELTKKYLEALKPALNTMAREVLCDIITDQIDPAIAKARGR